MKKIYFITLISTILLSFIIPMVMAGDTRLVGSGLGDTINVNGLKPNIYMCGHSYNLLDENKRQHNYGFEGERMSYDVLVVEPYGINTITDVQVTLGEKAQTGNTGEVQCRKVENKNSIDSSCGQVKNPGDTITILTTFNPDTMAYYHCDFVVETSESMHGSYFLAIQAKDVDENIAITDSEKWYFNPEIGLNVDGGLNFKSILPGKSSYSEKILVGNTAESGSQVDMNMFISGTDFYDITQNDAKCPTTNELSLSNFAYRATNGQYDSSFDPRSDSDGYTPIKYGKMSNPHNYDDRDFDLTSFTENNEVMQVSKDSRGFYKGNILTEGSDMGLSIRLNVPSPCKGNFEYGDIYVYGHVI